MHEALTGDAAAYKGWRRTEKKHLEEKLPPLGQESRETLPEKDKTPIKSSLSFQEQISQPI